MKITKSFKLKGMPKDFDVNPTKAMSLILTEKPRSSERSSKCQHAYCDLLELPSTSQQSVSWAADIDSTFCCDSQGNNPWIKVCRRKENKKRMPQANIRQPTAQRKPTSPRRNVQSKTTVEKTIQAMDIVRECISAPGLAMKKTSLIRFGITYSDAVRSTHGDEFAEADPTDIVENYTQNESTLEDQQQQEPTSIDSDDNYDDVGIGATITTLNFDPSNTTVFRAECPNSHVNVLSNREKSFVPTDTIVLHQKRSSNEMLCSKFQNIRSINDLSAAAANTSLQLVRSQNFENNQAPSFYPQYRSSPLEWSNPSVVQHFSMPNFNFLQPNQAYPNFLGHFTDNNYAKADNLAFLGLKLAMSDNLLNHYQPSRGSH